MLIAYMFEVVVFQWIEKYGEYDTIYVDWKENDLSYGKIMGEWTGSCEDRVGSSNMDFALQSPLDWDLGFGKGKRKNMEYGIFHME